MTAGMRLLAPLAALLLLAGCTGVGAFYSLVEPRPVRVARGQWS